MERLAEVAVEACTGTVGDREGFLPHFYAVTPERELERLNIGSRPARRGGG